MAPPIRRVAHAMTSTSAPETRIGHRERFPAIRMQRAVGASVDLDTVDRTPFAALTGSFQGTVS